MTGAEERFAVMLASPLLIFAAIWIACLLRLPEDGQT